MVKWKCVKSVVTITGITVLYLVYEDVMTKKRRKELLETSDFVKEWIKTKWIFVQWRETDKWECLGPTCRRKEFMYGEFYGSSSKPETIRSPFIKSVKIITAETKEEALCQMNLN